MPEVTTWDNRQLVKVSGRVVGVRIEDQETGKVYRADLATLDTYGYRFNRGWGEQIALPLTHWQVQGEPIQAALFA